MTALLPILVSLGLPLIFLLLWMLAPSNKRKKPPANKELIDQEPR